jgi:hypothetical protein
MSDPLREMTLQPFRRDGQRMKITIRRDSVAAIAECSEGAAVYRCDCQFPHFVEDSYAELISWWKR